MKKQSSFELVKEALEVGGIKHQTLEDETTKLIIIKGKDTRLLRYEFNKDGSFRRVV